MHGYRTFCCFVKFLRGDMVFLDIFAASRYSELLNFTLHEVFEKWGRELVKLKISNIDLMHSRMGLHREIMLCTELLDMRRKRRWASCLSHFANSATRTIQSSGGSLWVPEGFLFSSEAAIGERRNFSFFRSLTIAALSLTVGGFAENKKGKYFLVPRITDGSDRIRINC